MNIYLLIQNENRGYDTYDMCVVAAPDENTAKTIHPGRGLIWSPGRWCREDREWTDDTWANDPDNVTVEFIGVAKEGQKAGVICTSFNAG